jgi:iron complex transport system permease protein
MRRKYFQWVGFVGVLLLLAAGAALWSLTSGEWDISLTSLPSVLSDKTSMEYTILANIRIPRLLLAFSIGGALGITGAILQGVYRNPLVEPYTLGISGGAALGVALVIVLGLQASAPYILPAAGFAGALSAIFLVYFLGLKRGEVNINRMLLIE